MTAVEILRDARELIAEPTRWTTDRLARVTTDPESNDFHDAYPDANDPHAVCWCALGALCKAAGLGSWHDLKQSSVAYAAFGLLDAEARGRGFNAPADLNDALGHQAVLEMFDAAIKRGLS